MSHPYYLSRGNSQAVGKPLVTGRDALRTTLIAEAAERSASRREPVEVPRE